MKFKTFDFEGTEIRVGLMGDDIVMVAEDMQRLFGYGFGAFGTPRMLRAVAETGLQGNIPQDSRETSRRTPVSSRFPGNLP